MARRTLAQIADLIEDRVDKSRLDTTFDAFVQDMLILTLQEINAEIPWANWLLDEASLNATVSGTQYIVMPSDMDIDSFISLTDRSGTNRKVIRISPQDADLIDPGRDLSGDEILWWYQRVETEANPYTYEDRIYFLNRPDGADTLTAIFGVEVPQPTASQSAILPAKYEPCWMEGALAKVWEHLDPDSSRGGSHKAAFERGLEVMRRDANRIIGASHALLGHRSRQGSGISGAAFPANFGILP